MAGLCLGAGIMKFGKVAAIVAMTSIATIQPSMSEAQAACGKRSELIKMLKDKHKEEQRFFGMSGNKRVMELYISGDSSWTIVVSTPNGISCIVAVGRAGTIVSAQLPGSPT